MTERESQKIKKGTLLKNNSSGLLGLVELVSHGKENDIVICVGKDTWIKNEELYDWNILTRMEITHLANIAIRSI